jgi:hypothetical protein
MNSHIDADGLAEYRVGLITGRRGRQIADHLAICTQCASVADRLAEVSVLLAAVPQPAIPDAVAQRLQAALAAEPPIYQEQPVVTPTRSGFRLPGLNRPGLNRPGFKLPRLVPPRVLAPVAAVAVLAGGGFWLSQLAGSSASGPSFSGSSEAGPAAGATASSADHSAQVHVSGPFTGHTNEGMDIGVNQSLMITSSDTDLQAATLGSQLGALLSSQPRLHSTHASAAVKACVSAIAASRPVKLVASARYGGSPATVVIVNQSGRYQGIIAGPSCSHTDSDILATTVVPTGISTP